MCRGEPNSVVQKRETRRVAGLLILLWGRFPHSDKNFVKRAHTCQALRGTFASKNP